MNDARMDRVTDHQPEPVIIPAGGVLLRGTLSLLQGRLGASPEAVLIGRS
jgi:hypothetical protein